MYSFALNNDLYQPSGAINGSLFNKVVLRLKLQQPLVTAAALASQETRFAITETVNTPTPVYITAAQCALRDPVTGLPLYPNVTSVVVNTNGENAIFAYTYNLGVYVESVNFLRIVSGLANFVFAN
jgi:hypothetical protein